MEERVHILTQSVLFEGMKEDAIRAFLSEESVTIARVGREESVFEAGENPKALFVLLQGAVRVEKLEASGKRQLVNSFFEPGTIFGEVYLYLERPYDYSCRALRESEILAIPRRVFFEFSPLFQQNMLRVLAGKAFFLNQRLMVYAAAGLRQKILRHLFQMSRGRKNFRIPMTREEWADSIGTTRPSLSRELMEMQREGYLEIDRDRVHLLEKSFREEEFL